MSMHGFSILLDASQEETIAEGLLHQAGFKCRAPDCNLTKGVVVLPYTVYDPAGERSGFRIYNLSFGTLIYKSVSRSANKKRFLDGFEEEFCRGQEIAVEITHELEAEDQKHGYLPRRHEIYLAMQVNALDLHQQVNSELPSVDRWYAISEGLRLFERLVEDAYAKTSILLVEDLSSDMETAGATRGKVRVYGGEALPFILANQSQDPVNPRSASREPAIDQQDDKILRQLMNLDFLMLNQGS